MNRNMNLPQIQHIMMEFEKESEIMDMKEEMMSDTIDEAMEEEEDEEEQDAIVNQVLDEIGINLDDIVSCLCFPCACDDSVVFRSGREKLLIVCNCLWYSNSLLLLQEQQSRHQEVLVRSVLPRQRECLLTMRRFRHVWTTFAGNKYMTHAWALDSQSVILLFQQFVFTVNKAVLTKRKYRNSAKWRYTC